MKKLKNWINGRLDNITHVLIGMGLYFGLMTGIFWLVERLKSQRAASLINTWIAVIMFIIFGAAVIWLSHDNYVSAPIINPEILTA